MRRSFQLATVALITALATPAVADDAVRVADSRVVETQRQLAKATQSGDVATIVDARTKFQAAKAVAWGVRHPAQQPTVKLASTR
jgi:hypothetical protein